MEWEGLGKKRNPALREEGCAPMCFCGRIQPEVRDVMVIKVPGYFTGLLCQTPLGGLVYMPPVVLFWLPACLVFFSSLPTFPRYYLGPGMGPSPLYQYSSWLVWVCHYGTLDIDWMAILWSYSRPRHKAQCVKSGRRGWVNSRLPP